MKRPKQAAVSAPRAADHLDDIQAIVGSGFAALRHCTYWLLRVEDRDRARRWLRRLLQDRLVKSVDSLGRDSDPATGRPRHDEIAMVALTFGGLEALGFAQSDDYPFPTAFARGMGSPQRRKLYGDGQDGRWRWNDVGKDDVHLLVAHYRADERAMVKDGPLREAAIGDASGLRIVRRIDACPSYVQPERVEGRQQWRVTEPFGFRDGIAQPVIDGFRRSQAEQAASRALGERFEDRVVPAGEFLLGYRNGYGELAYCPDVKGWRNGHAASGPASRFAMNGSYLAVRQIVQHVDALSAFEHKHASAAPPGEPTLAERMVGRRTDGTPLVHCLQAAANPDAFRYRVCDENGLQCPRGAHVRRANPRDMLGWDVESGIATSKLHRLLRRGRVYAGQTGPCAVSTCGDPGHASGRDGLQRCAEGLFFIALNADLERQFEFVLQRWIGNRSFADLADEVDFTSSSPMRRSFTVQALPTGMRFEGFARFTEVVAGGYFFVPGLKALQFLAEGPAAR